LASQPKQPRFASLGLASQPKTAALVPECPLAPPQFEQRRRENAVDGAAKALLPPRKLV
jgi:hypothetical protein